MVLFLVTFPFSGVTYDGVWPLISGSEGHELKVEHVSVIWSDAFTADGFSKVIGHGFSENMKMRQY